MTIDLDAKAIRSRCQGYEYQADKTSGEEFAKWKNEKYEQPKLSKNKLRLVIVPLIDVFEGEKVLLPGITLHIRLHRSSNDFLLTSLGSTNSDEHFVAIFERASLFVTKMVVEDCCGSYRILVARCLPISENNKAAAQTFPKKMTDDCSLIGFINYHYNTAFRCVVIRLIDCYH